MGEGNRNIKWIGFKVPVSPQTHIMINPQEVPEGPVEISRRYRRAQECVLTLYHSFYLKVASFLGGAPSPATSAWGRCDHEKVTTENYRQINLR